MKPYGLRPGDGEKSPRTKNGRSTFIGNKFDGGPTSENGPKGKHKAAKMHDQRRLVHSQARADKRNMIHSIMREEMREEMSDCLTDERVMIIQRFSGTEAQALAAEILRLRGLLRNVIENVSEHIEPDWAWLGHNIAPKSS